MRAAIIDDEPLAREGMRLLLAPHADVEIVGEAGNGRDALALVTRVQPDVLFLDVQMPEVGGLELAAQLPADTCSQIIFVTAYDDFAVAAFDVHAIDYLVKPVDEARLAVALGRARERLALSTVSKLGDQLFAALAAMKKGPPPRDRLAIRDDDRVHLVPIDEIDWIEAADYYAEVHVGPRTYLHRESLQHLEESLDPDRFVRIHRSRLVNRSRIREIRWEGRRDVVVVLPGDVVLKVSRSHQAKLRGL